MLFWEQPPPPPPQPPPLAFHGAALDRANHTVDVSIQAAAQVSATVIIARHGVRLGRAGATLDRGGAEVAVRIGPKGLRRLRKGLHVDVLIYWGFSEPLRAHPALTLKGTLRA
jgi:hypothetical protein